MSGIGEQGHGVGPKAVSRLDGDESEVESDADGKGTPVAGLRSMGMPGVVTVGRVTVRMHDRSVQAYSRTAFDAAVSRLKAAAKSALV
jgi:hypothetical protein